MIRSQTIANHYLEQGLAVVRTDYEGLGTPGRHPYLMGRSLAQATVDMVRAGRDLVPTMSTHWVVAGHSEGGVAALFTASLSTELAPDLTLEGVEAFSPVLSMIPLFDTVRKVPVPVGGLTSLAALILDGAGTVDPGLDALYTSGGLSARALALYPDIQTKCLADLGKRDSWGGIAPSKVLGPTGEAAYTRFRRTLLANDASTLSFPAGLPVRIDQGGSDLVTFRVYADRFVADARARGVAVEYRVYPRAAHNDITDDRYGAIPGADWATNLLRK